MWLSLVERLVRDQDAAGSSPVIPTIVYNGMWLSLVERLVWDQDAAGSNPVTPIYQGRMQDQDG